MLAWISWWFSGWSSSSFCWRQVSVPRYSFSEVIFLVILKVLWVLKSAYPVYGFDPWRFFLKVFVDFIVERCFAKPAASSWVCHAAAACHCRFSLFITILGLDILPVIVASSAVMASWYPDIRKHRFWSNRYYFLSLRWDKFFSYNGSSNHLVSDPRVSGSIFVKMSICRSFLKRIMDTSSVHPANSHCGPLFRFMSNHRTFSHVSENQRSDDSEKPEWFAFLLAAALSVYDCLHSYYLPPADFLFLNRDRVGGNEKLTTIRSNLK